MKKFINSLVVVFTVLILNGCSMFRDNEEILNQYEKQVITDDCQYSDVKEYIKSDPLLWSLNGGSLAYHCGDYRKSIKFFDKAEAIFKKQELELDIKGVERSFLSILINNNINDYNGENYEKIMMNVYKGLDFMLLDDFDNARVEFNRALDRQRRASEYFQKEINEAYLEFNRSSARSEVMTLPTHSSEIPDYYGDITPAIIYPDFINPFATYMSALFFYLDHDYAKAGELFKQTLRMLPNQRQVKQDLILTERNSPNKQHYVWLIYENGLGMIKTSFTYQFPAYFFTDKIVSAQISLPTIEKRTSSYPYLLFNKQKTTEIADMDSIIQLEFNKKLPAIYTEAMLNMINNVGIQYLLEENLEEYGGKWLGFLYQTLTSGADIRQWRSLPKNFQIARIEIPNQPINIYKPDGSILTTVSSLSKDRDAIIYIKSDIIEHFKVHIIQKNPKYN